MRTTKKKNLQGKLSLISISQPRHKHRESDKFSILSITDSLSVNVGGWSRGTSIAVASSQLMNSLLTSTRLFVWTNAQNDYETSCISFVMVKSPGLLWFLSALPHRWRAEVKKSAHVRSSVRDAVKHWTAPLVLDFKKTEHIGAELLLDQQTPGFG